MKRVVFLMVVGALVTANAAQYTLFGVDDGNGIAGTSQFFTADCWADNNGVDVGPLYSSPDIEAIDSQTLGGTIYAVGGVADAANPNELYTVTTGGAITLVDADLGLANEVWGGSFRPGTTEFWVSIKNNGISYVNVATAGYDVTSITSSGSFEGIAWQDENTLYSITELGELSKHSYDGSTLSLVDTVDINPGGAEYEAMEFAPDGKLVVAQQKADEGYFEVDLDGTFGALTSLATYDGARDIESFTFIPEPTTMSMIAVLSGAFVFIRRRFIV